MKLYLGMDAFALNQEQEMLAKTLLDDDKITTLIFRAGSLRTWNKSFVNLGGLVVISEGKKARVLVISHEMFTTSVRMLLSQYDSDNCPFDTQNFGAVLKALVASHSTCRCLPRVEMQESENDFICMPTISFNPDFAHSLNYPTLKEICGRNTKSDLYRINGLFEYTLKTTLSEQLEQLVDLSV